MTTLLQIVQDACVELSIKRPLFVAASTDVSILRLLRFLNKEGLLQVSGDHLWRSLVREALFTTVANENQGAIATIAPGYEYMLPETLNDRSLAYWMRGSISPKEWQERKAVPISGGLYDFRVIQNNLHIIPAPSAGQTVAFEYVTANWVLNADGVTTYAKFTNDTDTALLDAELLTLGAVWRYRQFTGLEWGESFAEYNARKKLLIARDVPPQTLDFGGRIEGQNIIGINSVAGTVSDGLTTVDGRVLIA